MWLASTGRKMSGNESSDGEDEFNVESRTFRKMGKRLKVLEERGSALRPRRQKPGSPFLGAGHQRRERSGRLPQLPSQRSSSSRPNSPGSSLAGGVERKATSGIIANASLTEHKLLLSAKMLFRSV